MSNEAYEICKRMASQRGRKELLLIATALRRAIECGNTKRANKRLRALRTLSTLKDLASLLDGSNESLVRVAVKALKFSFHYTGEPFEADSYGLDEIALALDILTRIR